MAKVPYIPLYIGDWEQDTNCLSLQAEAAWLKIIFKMFKNDKNGIYKTSTKSLQNLWKTNTSEIQNILNELKENNICELEIGEMIVFSNRRMLRDAEISEKRTKAVQTRYKKPTKPIQKPDIDNEYDNECENDTVNEILLPFSSSTFLQIWGQWKEYKNKEHKFKYRTPQSEQAALMDLTKKANHNEITAIEIIGQSMANGWKGFFELKTNNNGKPKQQSGISDLEDLQQKFNNRYGTK